MQAKASTWRSERGDKVILFSDRCGTYIIYLLALWEMGCIVIPLGINIPNGRLQAVIEECEPQALVVIQNDNVTVKYYEVTLEMNLC